MMKIICAAALVALFAVPAYGQKPSMNILQQERTKTPEEIEQDKVNDKAHRDSLRKIPDAKATNDPWGNVRGTDSRNTAAQPKPRTKPDSATGR